jgi:hypothetical protein
MRTGVAIDALLGFVRGRRECGFTSVRAGFGFDWILWRRCVRGGRSLGRRCRRFQRRERMGLLVADH